MKAKLFTRSGCGHCDNVRLPKEGVVTINVADPEYSERGFVPNQVPMLQFGDVVLVGAQHINDFFNAAKLIS